MNSRSKSTDELMDNITWHSLDVKTTLQKLNAQEKTGLTTQEAHQRIKQYGPNALQEGARATWQKILIRQFIGDMLIIILLAAAAIAFATGEVTDGFTILAIVILNGCLGFFQEWRAERAIAALKQMLSQRCRVIRDGIEQIINADHLVPGDLVILEIGNRVPADIRLINTVNLKADESTLTGESLSVTKNSSPVTPQTPLAERASIAWMGTNITNGFAHGVVVTTGMHTEFGRIAKLTAELGEEPTHLQRKLSLLGKQLGLVSIGIAIFVGVAGWLLGKPLATMFLTAISLGVAVVPEGLPAVVTITMALGIRVMSKRRALLRRLQAAETLGATTIICTDKTGTLTKNEMTVTKIWLPNAVIDVTGVGYSPEGEFRIDQNAIDHHRYPGLLALLETGVICTHAQLARDKSGWHPFGEPTEAALLSAAYKADIHLSQATEEISEFSFNSTRKRMTIVLHQENENIAYTKGAPEVILKRARYIQEGSTIREMTSHDRQKVIDAYTEMANQGLRTLALAKRILPHHLELTEENVETELTLLGIVGIIDPPRTEVIHALKLATQAGIRTLMITGDAALTASAIAKQIGLRVDTLITGSELDNVSDKELLALLDNHTLFARTTPEHKLRIVTLLQQLGHVVGMTGDGVNDAPALKKADIGIAMGMRGTDVAKSASDMVLTDDNFASIVGAIEEGRRQYNNIKKFIRYMLSSNLGEVVAIFFNVIFGGPLILLPVQILWMNLVTDGVTAIALGVDPAEKDIMRQAPNKTTAGILDHKSLLVIALLGTYIGLATLWLFHHFHGQAAAQTAAFTGIIVIEKMNVLNFRSLKYPLFRVGFFSNPWLLVAIAFNMGLQCCAVYIPFMQSLFHTVALGWSEWGVILLAALPVFMITEAYKWVLWFFRRQETNA